MKDFNEGFTELSYFNIFKEVVLTLYERYAEGGKLDFKYRDDNVINASVEYNEYTMEDMLRVNVGTIVDVFAMMKTAFAQNNILDALGNSCVEVNQKIFGEFLGKEYSIRYNGIPIDDTRQMLSDYTSLFALRFILAHELGHVLNGHTKYLKEAYMNSRIDMRLNKGQDVREYCLDRRTLEMDADAFAATSSIDHVISLYYENRNDKIFSFLSKPEDVFVLWGFAVSCVFYKFETLQKTEYSKYGNYLPNEGRFIMTLGAALETIDAYAKHGVVRIMDEDKAKILLSVAYGLNQAKKFFYNIYDQNFCWLEQWNNDTYANFSDEVLNNWNNKLYYELKPYSRTMLYLPSKMDEIMEQIKSNKLFE